ncbi:MAG: sigma-54 dependent transcriptional regulator [Desulfobacula sp.]|nr:sigma-54 dependent transcriptional regulator [Desulfobacula sp.]
MANVLIIDDDKLICDILAKMMGKIGHESCWALTGKDGLDKARHGMFDIVFLDVNLPDANGLDLIKTIKTGSSSPEVIIITGDSDPHGAEMAINSGAWNYLEKPFLRQELNLQVSRALQFRKERGDVSMPGVLKRNGIIGESEEINSCLDKVSIAAYSDTNVLISGGEGIGKKLFAKTIHLNSDRSENNFVIIDCSALNGNNVESVLFGHEKGAFAGAVNSKTGLVERADNGTLFLDEVPHLPMQIQKSFLRVIENLTFSRVGGKTEQTSNFRVVATTSKNLDDLSDQGLFRKDLLYKLKGISIRLPLLKETKEDLLKIAFFYIDRFCMKYNLDTKGISPEFIDILKAYDWPGNVRELISAIDRAIACAKNEPTLYSIHLPSYIKAKVIKRMIIKPPLKTKGDVNGFINGEVPSLKKMMADTEKQYLKKLMTYTDCSVKKACDIAEVSRSCMYARLKKYHIHEGLTQK